MVHGCPSLEVASSSLGNALTTHGGRPLLAQDASSSAGNAFTTHGARPLLAGGRVPLPRERVHQAWWTVALRWRTRPPRSGARSPGMVRKPRLALGFTPFARQDAHLVAWSGHPWQEARSPRQVSSTAAKPSRPGSQKSLRLEARQAVTLGTGLIARTVWAPGVASAVLPLFLGAPSPRAPAGSS